MDTSKKGCSHVPPIIQPGPLTGKRVEYIHGLLEEGRPVPDPNPVFGPRPRGEDVREVAYVITSLRETDCGEGG